ncbi:MAG: tryptophan synthase subunit alpha [Magnetococcales bacterium]|nr:tryptophan synthase subunit alpha [Magnetococcales bacterium]
MNARPDALHPLEATIRQRLQERRSASQPNAVLLMSHWVLGYPSLAANRPVIDQMVANGVDLMELQIPFSEPIADGPVIAHANQTALDNGFRVAAGLAFIEETVARHPIPFLIMTYYNILMAYGVENFIREAARLGVRGLIIPDLPPQEAGQVMAWCQKWGATANGLAWIHLLTPTSTDARLQTIGALAQGFCYCVARKGVTGTQTSFDASLHQFLDRCRRVTPVPLAVGFGVKNAEDVRRLTGMAEIAVVGSAAIEIYQAQGAEAVGRFFAGLRQPGGV